jgi:hypothetical protein
LSTTGRSRLLDAVVDDGLRQVGALERLEAGVPEVPPEAAQLLRREREAAVVTAKPASRASRARRAARRRI